MSIHRRKFLESSGLVALGAFLPGIRARASASDPLEPFQWKTDELVFVLEVPRTFLHILMCSRIALPKSCGGRANVSGSR
jgi:hypothetical protein